MTTKLNRWLLAVLLLGVTTTWALAQDADANSNSKDAVRTVTGCLTKNGGGDEYLLTGNDGSTWEIHEDAAVSLASHVNKTVQAKGVVSHEKMHNMKEDAKDMAHDTGTTKAHAEHGHLKVTDIHTVSESCQQ